MAQDLFLLDTLPIELQSVAWFAVGTRDSGTGAETPYRTPYPAITAGSQGVGVANVVKNEFGHLIVTLTNSSSIDVGLIDGAPGIQGPPGVAGRNVTGSIINGEGHLIVSFSDGSTIDAGFVGNGVGGGGGGGGTTYAPFSQFVTGLVPAPNSVSGRFLGDDGGWHTTATGDGTPGGTNGQLQINAGGSFAGVTVAGDGTISNSGTLSVTRINGQTPSSIAFSSYGQLNGTTAAGNDPRIVNAEQVSNRGVPGGYSTLDGLGKVTLIQLPIGNSAGTVAAGDDSRIAAAEVTANKNQVNGYLGLNGSGHFPASFITNNGAAAGPVISDANNQIPMSQLPSSRQVTIDGTINLGTLVTPYQMLAANFRIWVNKTTASDTYVRLPTAPAVGEEYWIIDDKGDWNTHPLTVDPGAKTIDGTTGPQVFSDQFGIITLVANPAGNWRIT